MSHFTGIVMWCHKLFAVILPLELESLSSLSLEFSIIWAYVGLDHYKHLALLLLHIYQILFCKWCSLSFNCVYQILFRKCCSSSFNIVFININFKMCLQIYVRHFDYYHLKYSPHFANKSS